MDSHSQPGWSYTKKDLEHLRFSEMADGVKLANAEKVLLQRIQTDNDSHERHFFPRANDEKAALSPVPPSIKTAISWYTSETALKDKKRKTPRKEKYEREREGEKRDESAPSESRPCMKWTDMPYVTPKSILNPPLPQIGSLSGPGTRGGRETNGINNGERVGFYPEPVPRSKMPSSPPHLALPPPIAPTVRNNAPDRLDREPYAIADIPPTPPLPPVDLQPPPLRYPETVSNLIEIRHSALGGLGVFALKNIPAGTILLSEKPLVVFVDDGTRVDPLIAAVKALSPTQLKAFYNLSSYSSRPSESRLRSIVYSNGFTIGMGSGVFETASRINHSCLENTKYVWKESIGRMVYYNSFRLEKGEEITVNYGHTKKWLKIIYGFDCTCPLCTIDAETEARDKALARGTESMSLNSGVHEGTSGST